MKYTAHQHRPSVIKVETKDRVICDAISDMDMAERIASALNLQEDTELLVQSAHDLNSIVDGPFNLRWEHNGVRLTDTPQWCAFFVALQRLVK